MTELESYIRKVVVLVNRRSGFAGNFNSLNRGINESWEDGRRLVYYQFLQNLEDGRRKVASAVSENADAVLVAGGDGTISTVGASLINTGVIMGAVPFGSGNGFARHFEIPLAPEKALRSLANGRRLDIDVGMVDGRPFFVTCSMAWDAAIVRSFEKYPVRGILPYVFAGVQEFFEYEPQKLTVRIDDSEEAVFNDALLFSVANLSQYGGGARIAPNACPDDGFLELIVAARKDIGKLLANIARFFDGRLTEVPEVFMRKFKKLTVYREKPSPIQVDGDLVDAGKEVVFSVDPKALRILAPDK